MKVRAEPRGDPDNTLLELLMDEPPENASTNRDEPEAVDMLSDCESDNSGSDLLTKSLVKDESNYPYLEKAKSPPMLTSTGRGGGGEH